MRWITLVLALENTNRQLNAKMQGKNGIFYELGLRVV